MMKKTFKLPSLFFHSGIFAACTLFSGLHLHASPSLPERSPITSTLRASESNFRYFTDASGKTIYLTGSHTWANLQDGNLNAPNQNPPPAFDYNKYLDFLVANNHNFFRLWTQEIPKADFSKDTWGHAVFYPTPLPWERTGPGLAGDGKPKFDLERFNQVYFDRMRSRVTEAGERGIYASILLFDGFAYDWLQGDLGWDYNPYNINNNVNGIDGSDDESNHSGVKTHSLKDPKITALQKAYIRKVIETVGHLDNVLFEISNEDTGGTEARDWQYEMIRFIKQTEASANRKIHPVGMSATGFKGKGWVNVWLKESPADFILPGHMPDDEDLKTTLTPTASSIFNNKVVFADTDHVWGIGGDQSWIWKAFTRGYNVIYMDPYGMTGYPDDVVVDPEVHPAMGDTLFYANRINLASLEPIPSASSTTYCLANPGQEYLIYNPDLKSVTINHLPAGQYTYEWFNGKRGPQKSHKIKQLKDGPLTLAPQALGTVLHLKKKASSSLRKKRLQRPLRY